ncbi:TPA: hypothetical protein ACPFOS_004053 [Escherichia coli]|nr:hypothetical protein [Salmonella enterica]EBX4171659.1 hypothetical protein [Salmonella enterica subsp. enterica serovar Stanley]EFF9406428.1 hypothetical protein [Escherichia coli]EGP0755719.1 hypothetical protein [Escherichia coli]EJL1513560.1 hypothetical protein [Salmonella enterica]
MMNEASAPDNIYGYFERNRWLVIIIGIVMLNASMLIGGFFLLDLGQDPTMVKTSPPLIYSVIGGCVKAVSILLLIYAGILNMMCNTLSARVFRMVFMVVMLAGFIAFLLKMLNLY